MQCPFPSVDLCRDLGLMYIKSCNPSGGDPEAKGFIRALLRRNTRCRGFLNMKQCSWPSTQAFGVAMVRGAWQKSVNVNYDVLSI